MAGPDPLADSAQARERRAIILQQNDIHAQLAAPLGGGKRVKFTSVDQSRNYLALGANTGSVYVYKRQNLQFVKLLSNISDDLSPIRCVALSPDEKHLALGTDSGHLLIVAVKLAKLKGKEKVVLRVAEHAGHTVTSLCWGSESKRVFSGDDNGLVVMSVVNATSYSLFRNCDLVHKEDTAIVQLEIHPVTQQLLVSSLQRSLIIDTKAQKPQSSQYMVSTQIGSAKRNGSYGGCFANPQHHTTISAYCARPGKSEKRLWKVDTEACKVEATLKFAVDQKASPFITATTVTSDDDACIDGEEPSKTPSFSLSRLHSFGSGHILSWSGNSVGIIDPVSVHMVAWYISLGEIVDLSVFGESFVAIHGTEKTVSFVTDVPPAVYLERLVGMELWTRAAVFARSRKVGELPLLYSLYESMNAVERDDDEDGQILESLKGWIVELETQQASAEANAAQDTAEESGGKSVLNKARSTLTSIKEFYRKTKVSRQGSTDSASLVSPAIGAADTAASIDSTTSTTTTTTATTAASGVVNEDSDGRTAVTGGTWGTGSRSEGMDIPARNNKVDSRDTEGTLSSSLGNASTNNNGPKETAVATLSTSLPKQGTSTHPTTATATPSSPSTTTATSRASRQSSVDATTAAVPIPSYDPSAPDVPAAMAADVVMASSKPKKTKTKKKKKRKEVDIAPAGSPAKTPTAPDQTASILAPGADWSPGAHADSFIARLKAKDPSLVPPTPTAPSTTLGKTESKAAALPTPESSIATSADDDTHGDPYDNATAANGADTIVPATVSEEGAQDSTDINCGGGGSGTIEVEDKDEATPVPKSIDSDAITAGTIATDTPESDPQAVTSQETLPVVIDDPNKPEALAVQNNTADVDGGTVNTEGTATQSIVPEPSQADNKPDKGSDHQPADSTADTATESKPSDETGATTAATTTTTPESDTVVVPVGEEEAAEVTQASVHVPEKEVPTPAAVVTVAPAPAGKSKKKKKHASSIKPAPVTTKATATTTSTTTPSTTSTAAKSTAVDPATKEGQGSVSKSRGSVAQEAMSDIARKMTSATQNAYASLSAYRADQRSDVLRPALKQWLQAFDQTIQEGEVHLESIPTLWINELMTACFELRVSSDPSPDVSLSDKWTDEQAAAFLKRYFVYLDKPRCFKRCVANQFESSIEAMHVLELQHDVATSAAATARQSVQQCISSKDGRGALERIQKRSNLGLTLRFLGQLFELVPRPTLDYCVGKFPSIEPWCVEKHLRARDPLMYVDYLTTLIKKHEICRSNMYVVAHYLHCMIEVDFLETESKRGGSDQAGISIHAHRKTWQCDEAIREVIHHPDRYPFDWEYLVDTFTRVQYYHGVLYLLRAQGQVHQALDLVLTVDDVTSFLHIVEHTTDGTLWERSIAALLKRSPKDEIEWEITPNVLLRSMCISLGPTQTLHLLQKTPAILEGISSDFYRDVVVTAGVGVQQQEQLYHLLEKVNSHMWTHKTSTQAAQFRQFREDEMRDAKMKGSKFVKRSIDGPVLVLKHTTPIPGVFDDNTSHWGVEVDVTSGSQAGICTQCTLPLSAGLGAASDLLIFSCGHAFHTYCVSDDACLTCLQQNFTSLDPDRRKSFTASTVLQ